MSDQRIFLITGGNRSIGLAIVQKLAQASPKDHFLIASRSVQAGEEAVAELRKVGITAPLSVVQLDLNDDASQQAAVKHLTEAYGRLDILINNAGVGKAATPVPGEPDYASKFRKNFGDVYQLNVISLALFTELCLPLLHKAPEPMVINVSSVRGSLTSARSRKVRLPPVIAYPCSKAALNIWTLELQNKEDEAGGSIRYYLACPGYCKTAFNGYRGPKDPLDGAKVVEELVMAPEGKYEFGFYNWEDNGFERVPW
ncbi:MAG: hypothetical protein M1820_000442 [Bogoriella megaspora]|nr:MAG: hypothetical protein M1820_000442 [Bogoriella megaspora]